MRSQKGLFFFFLLVFLGVTLSLFSNLTHLLDNLINVWASALSLNP